MNNQTLSLMRSTSSSKSFPRVRLSPIRTPSRNSNNENINENFDSSSRNYYQEDILKKSKIDVNIDNNLIDTKDQAKLLINRNIDYLTKIKQNENELLAKFDSLYEEINNLKEKIKSLDTFNNNLQEEKNKQLSKINNFKNCIIALCKIISENKSNMTVEEVNFKNLSKIQELPFIKNSGIDIITDINRSDIKFKNYIRDPNINDIENSTYNLFIKGQQFYPIQEQDSASEMMENKKHTAIYIQLSLMNISETYNINYKIAMRLKNNIKDKDSESIGITEEKTGKNLEFSSMFKIILSHDMEQCLLFEIFRNNDNFSNCTTKCINSSSLKNLENSNNNYIKVCESYLPLSQLLNKNNMEIMQEVKGQAGKYIGQLKIKGYLKVEDYNEQTNKSCNLSFEFEFLNNSKNDISLVGSFYFLRANFGEFKRIVYKSDEFKNDSSLIDNFKIDKKQLVNSNDELVEIEFVDRKKHKSVGKGTFSINEIKIKKNKGYFDLCDVDYPNLKIAKYFINLEEKEIMTFDKFKKTNYKFKVDIAIDYGKGNKENNCSPRDYLVSIENCVKILSEFVSNKSFTFYAFGGNIIDSDKSTKQKLEPTCYFKSNNEIEGIEGIINEYKKYLNQRLQFQPTRFSPIINEVINKIENDHEKNKYDGYYILMIFTSGKIDDLDNTRNAIMMAAGYPLSIIIIGIGCGNFSDMIELDSAEQLFKNEKGETVRRDLVRFVKFENFKNKIMNNDFYGYQELKEDLLKEIPKHIKDYFNEID